MNQRFKEARVRAGMTATAAAKALGVSPTTVSNWDLGRKQPSLELLCKVADLYGVTTDYLLGQSDLRTAVEPERTVSDDDIKFALFGGNGEITDAMYEEVKRFAAFIRDREAEKKKE